MREKTGIGNSFQMFTSETVWLQIQIRNSADYTIFVFINYGYKKPFFKLFLLISPGIVIVILFIFDKKPQTFLTKIGELLSRGQFIEIFKL